MLKTNGRIGETFWLSVLTHPPQALLKHYSEPREELTVHVIGAEASEIASPELWGEVALLMPHVRDHIYVILSAHN